MLKILYGRKILSWYNRNSLRYGVYIQNCRWQYQVLLQKRNALNPASFRPSAFLCEPRIGINQFSRDSVTYEGVGSTKKWERIESYGPKFVKNIVQAISRDIFCYAMKALRHCFIVGHVHDELIIECNPCVDLKAVCEQMGRAPDWMPDILLRADGYETDFYKKD